LIVKLTDLFWGVLYYICIPAGYLFLIIYAICNLNNVSWGTRETQTAVLVSQEHTTQKKKKTEGELESISGEVIDDVLNQVKETRLKDVTCADMIPSIFRWINNLIILRSLESVVNIYKNTDNDGDDEGEDSRTLMRQTFSSCGCNSPAMKKVPTNTYINTAEGVNKPSCDILTMVPTRTAIINMAYKALSTMATVSCV
jgi:hypothetical protein